MQYHVPANIHGNEDVNIYLYLYYMLHAFEHILEPPVTTLMF